MSGDHPNYNIFLDRPEYWEESWKLEETCCHSNSSEKPSFNTGVKNSKRSNNNNNNNNNNKNNYNTDDET